MRLKNKYQRLTKDEKKQAIIDYKEAGEKELNTWKHIKRLKIVSIIGMLYSVISILFYVFVYTSNWWDYVMSSVLFIFCLLFFYKSQDVLSNTINNYLIKKDKKQK